MCYFITQILTEGRQCLIPTVIMSYKNTLIPKENNSLIQVATELTEPCWRLSISLENQKVGMNEGILVINVHSRRIIWGT